MTPRTVLTKILVLGSFLGAVRCRPSPEKSADIAPSAQGIAQDTLRGLATATAPLENTYWILTHLGDAAVTIPSRQPQPHLILNSAKREVGGSGGCNRLGGSYELQGDRLSLGRVISTLMACPEGMETEKAFLDALGRVDRWRIVGQHLELLDAGGKVVARLEAQSRQ